MSKDTKMLQNLYESIHSMDFLHIDESEVDTFDWEKFFINEHMTNFGGMFLLEDFKFVKSEPTLQGNQDVYEIVLRNGKTFNLFMNYIVPGKVRDYVFKFQEAASHKDRNDISSNYEEYFSDLAPNDTIVIMQFKDSDERHELTGDVGYSTPELFAALRQAFMDSVKKTGGDNNLKAVVMRVSKKEQRRLVVYRKLIQRYLKDFPNIFEDDFNETDYILLTATK
jgi:hypothetical protein